MVSSRAHRPSPSIQGQTKQTEIPHLDYVHREYRYNKCWVSLPSRHTFYLRSSSSSRRIREHFFNPRQWARVLFETNFITRVKRWKKRPADRWHVSQRSQAIKFFFPPDTFFYIEKKRLGSVHDKFSHFLRRAPDHATGTASPALRSCTDCTFPWFFFHASCHIPSKFCPTESFNIFSTHCLPKLSDSM